MGQVTLRVAGRDYPVTCRDGEEPKLLHLATLLDAQSGTAVRAAGGAGERTLLYIALLLADQLDELRKAPVEGGIAPALLDDIALRLEKLASALEQTGGSA